MAVNPKRTRQRKLVFVGLISIVLLFSIQLFPPSVLEPIRFAVNFVAQPVERIFSFLGFKINDAFSVLNSIGAFKEENTRLLNENIRLQSEVARLSSEEQENIALRDQLGVPQKVVFSKLSAEVIGRTYTDLGRWITLNRGSFDGVRTGMPVIIADGVLIGRIDDVSSDNARVMLLTHPESAINAQDELTQAEGVVRGAYGLGFLFDRVPQMDSIVIGDRILTSGLGGGVPSGLLVGTVEEILQTPDHLFQQATLKPTIPFEKIRFVHIIRSW